MNEWGRGGLPDGPARYMCVPQFWQQEYVREAAEDNHSKPL